jgi:hypothetical protein
VCAARVLCEGSAPIWQEKWPAIRSAAGARGTFCPRHKQEVDTVLRLLSYTIIISAAAIKHEHYAGSGGGGCGGVILRPHSIKGPALLPHSERDPYMNTSKCVCIHIDVDGEGRKMLSAGLCDALLRGAANR